MSTDEKKILGVCDLDLPENVKSVLQRNRIMTIKRLVGLIIEDRKGWHLKLRGIGEKKKLLIEEVLQEYIAEGAMTVEYILPVHDIRDINTSARVVHMPVVHDVIKSSIVLHFKDYIGGNIPDIEERKVKAVRLVCDKDSNKILEWQYVNTSLVLERKEILAFFRNGKVLCGDGNVYALCKLYITERFKALANAIAYSYLEGDKIYALVYKDGTVVGFDTSKVESYKKYGCSSLLGD